jgi:protease-4
MDKTVNNKELEITVGKEEPKKEEKKSSKKTIEEMQKEFLKTINLKKEKKLYFLLNLKITIYLFVISSFILLAFSLFVSMGLDENIKMNNFDPKIGIININQEITNEYVDLIIEEMDTIYEDKSSKNWQEIMIVMNSGGGSPTASEELSEYLKDFNENKMPVSMYVENVAASGAYYIASSIHPLNANRNAIIGSIGVIMPNYNIKEFADKLGIKEETITSGKYKEPLSYFKGVTPESKEYLEKHMLTPTYMNFIQRVSENRNKSIETIKDFADGKIYIANMSEIKNVLVDNITTKIEMKNELIKKYGKSTKFIYIKEKQSEISNLLGTKMNFNLKVDLGNSNYLK